MNNTPHTTEDMFEEIIKQKDAGATREVLVLQYPEMKEDIAFLFDSESSLKQAFHVQIPDGISQTLDTQFLVTPSNEARHIYTEGVRTVVPSPYQHIINRIQKTLAFGIPVLVILVLVIQITPTVVVSPTQQEVFDDVSQVSRAKDTPMNRSSSEKEIATTAMMYSTESATDASLVDSVIDSIYQDMNDEYTLSEDESLDASLFSSDTEMITSYNTNFYDNTL
jgi:hypothetical protein